MQAFSFLKCEVEFYIDQAKIYPTQQILAKMASDKGLICGLERTDSEVLYAQLATMKRAVTHIDSSIYEYLLSVVMLRWVKGMKIISLSFSEEPHSIHQVLSVENRINMGKCTEDYSLSDDDKSETSTGEFLEHETETLQDLIYFNSNDVEFNLNQVRKLYNSKLLEKINFDYERTRFQISAGSRLSNSTTSEAPLGVVKIDIIKPEDSASNVVSSSFELTLKIATKTFTVGDWILNSSSIQDWSDVEVKELLKELKADFKGIDGFSLLLVAQDLIDYEGDKLSKIEFATSSLRNDNDFNFCYRISKVIVRWVYDNLLEIVT